ncbi:MAG TPA: hypothetical protein VJS92_01440 [Candidatus Polarisedimenticolaceae bacterium]|nr:hypothetical protein [Candidatus Polarisedimenticolaceae bacterium]
MLWRAVAWSMRVGALYDLAFGGAILGFAPPAARALGLALPPDPLYLGLVGVLLLLLGALYLLPGAEPQRYQGVVAIAAAGRLAGAAYLGAAWLRGEPPAFLALAAADLLLGATHGALLLGARSRKYKKNQES